MISSGLLQNLTIDDLFLLDAESLTEPACLSKLSELAEDSLLDLEPGQARDFYDALNDLALQYQASFQNKPESFAKINSILVSLFWKAISVLPAQQRKEALTRHLLSAISNNVDVRYYLQKYLDNFELLLPPDKEERKITSRLIESNEEVLGSSLILIANKEKAQPTVKNWLADYNSYAAFNNIRNIRGNYEQIKYLNSSTNIKLLSKPQQALLFKVIELYDWLLFPSQFRTNIPLAEESPIRQPTIIAPVAPAATTAVVSKTAPQRARIANVAASSNQQTAASSPKPMPAVPKVAPKPPGIAPFAPPSAAVNRGNVNLQDILNERMDSAKFGGVIWDNKPSNVNLGDVKKNVEQKRLQTEAEIAKKLEDLKKRKTSV